LDEEKKKLSRRGGSATYAIRGEDGDKRQKKGREKAEKNGNLQRKTQKERDTEPLDLPPSGGALTKERPKKHQNIGKEREGMGGSIAVA